MLHCVALVRTDVSEEPSASFIRVTRIGELGTMLVTASAVPSSPILVTLMKEALGSFQTLVLTRAMRHNIPEDAILHSHRHENLKSYRDLKVYIFSFLFNFSELTRQRSALQGILRIWKRMSRLPPPVTSLRALTLDFLHTLTMLGSVLKPEGGDSFSHQRL
jgi:hypothetical protein